MSHAVLRLRDLAWPDVRAAVASGLRTAIFAVGSTEQHGPHLPLFTDTLIGEALCERVAQEIGGAIVAPPIPVGVSAIHMDFPGSLTIGASVLRGTVAGYCESLAKHGFAQIVVIPSHGGNFAAVDEAMTVVAAAAHRARFVGFTDWPALRAAFLDILAADGMTLDAPGLHAGEVETSIMLHIHPELVRMELAQAGYTGAPGSGRPYATSIAEASPIGVLGDPRPASSARGERHLNAWVRLIVQAVTARAAV
jgi:creatinine amidohydrolase